MPIDLNDPGALTKESVRALIAAHSDTTDTQLRVTKDGIAFISATEVGRQNINELMFRFETWQAGNDWVGPNAADCESWVNRIHQALKKNWPIRQSSFIEIY